MKSSNDTPVAIQLKSTWTKIYKNWFNKKVNFTELAIPNFYDETKHFAVIVAQDITMDEVIVALRNEFKVYHYPDLDISEITNDRIANKDYVIIFNKNIEADDNLKDLSANELAEMNISGITLLERLLLEIFYFNQTEKHLDFVSWTLCSGSHNSDSTKVASVGWHYEHSKLRVDLYCIDESFKSLRSRAVVTQ